MKRKRGMKEGHQVYKREKVLLLLTTPHKEAPPMTIKAIWQAHKEHVEETMPGIKPINSWQTIKRYLDLYVEEGLVECIKAGRIRLYRRK